MTTSPSFRTRSSRVALRCALIGRQRPAESLALLRGVVVHHLPVGLRHADAGARQLLDARGAAEVIEVAVDDQDDS